MSILRQYFQGFLDLFLRSHCALCERDCDEYLCKYCYKQVNQCQLRHPQQFWQ
jgi:hypothetical protein